MDPHVLHLRQSVEALQRDLDYLIREIAASSSLVELRDRIGAYPWESKP